MVHCENVKFPMVLELQEVEHSVKVSQFLPGLECCVCPAAADREKQKGIAESWLTLDVSNSAI